MPLLIGGLELAPIALYLFDTFRIMGEKVLLKGWEATPYLYISRSGAFIFIAYSLAVVLCLGGYAWRAGDRWLGYLSAATAIMTVLYIVAFGLSWFGLKW